MLIEFRVENHRSIRSEQALSLAAGRGGDPADARPRQVPGTSDPVLPVAAIYGANASGKSNVLLALAFLRDAVVESHRAWPPDGGVPWEPFEWGGGVSPSLFEITFIVDGTRYQYGFSTDGDAFQEEWLHAWPHGHKQVWFERDRQEFKFGERLRGENRVVADVTRPNALFLSASAQLGHEQLSPVYRWLSGIQVKLERRRAPWGAWLVSVSGVGGAWLERLRGSERDAWLNGALRLLQAADVGIVDIRVSEAGEDAPPRGMPSVPPRRRVYLRHRGVEPGWLPLEEESHGTRTLFQFAAPMLDALARGGVLLVDELEAGLHPLLAQQIVRQFNDPALNPKNAQLIFTTHDTNLLGTVVGEPALRRDQVWLTEKNASGATELYPLTDYQPRKQENVERGYLQGRYGAIPFLGDLVRPGATE